MLLSVCVNQSIDPSIAVVSDSTGHIITIDLIHDQIINKWIGHRLSYQSIDTTCETWSTAFCANNSSLIFSGGDDGQFKYWDIRQTLQTPVMINKSHKSGVVFISTISPLITGSYDEYIRVWDIRRFDQPVNERQLDGGVWNVQLDNTNDKQQLLVACMYGGWMRLMVDDLTIINSNQQLGEQLLYDVCVCDNSQSIVACTFNNRTVYLIKNN
jgi:diphthamide biosynthesis protein 7